MATRIDILNRALTRIGADPLVSESADGSETHLAVFDSVLEDLLSRAPWTFAKTTRQLVRRGAAPIANWRYGFQMPGDILGSPQAAFDTPECRWPFTAWELHSGELLSNAEAVWLRFGKKPEPVYWPGYFRECVTLAVMAELALSVREDTGLRKTLRENVYGAEGMMGQGGLLGQAMILDAQGQPSPVIEEGANPLVDVRF